MHFLCILSTYVTFDDRATSKKMFDCVIYTKSKPDLQIIKWKCIFTQSRSRVIQRLRWLETRENICAMEAAIIDLPDPGPYLPIILQNVLHLVLLNFLSSI